MHDELESIVIGEKIGRGVHRDVYVFAPNKNFVIKVAIGDDGRGVNILEEKLWADMYETPISKWFAPVTLVSPGGKYLIQARLEPMRRKDYPKMIPHFFTDTKYSNFGWLPDKGFVCCDYGSFNMFRGVSIKMVKANWWE